VRVTGDLLKDPWVGSGSSTRQGLEHDAAEDIRPVSVEPGATMPLVEQARSTSVRCVLKPGEQAG